MLSNCLILISSFEVHQKVIKISCLRQNIIYSHFKTFNDIISSSDLHTYCMYYVEREQSHHQTFPL